MFDHEYILDMFTYGPMLGWFINRYSRGRAKEGTRAGAIAHGGYRRIVIGYQKVYEHQLAWFYVYGEWPDELDHIDGNPSNNAIANLRPCSRTQNNCNAQMPTGQSGLRGAYLDLRSLKWVSKIQFGGQKKYLGSFDTPEEAHEAFMEAAEQLHGEFFRNDIDPIEGT